MHSEHLENVFIFQITQNKQYKLMKSHIKINLNTTNFGKKSS